MNTTTGSCVSSSCVFPNVQNVVTIRTSLIIQAFNFFYSFTEMQKSGDLRCGDFFEV